LPQDTQRQVFFYDGAGRLCSVPVSFTSLAKSDPFVVVSAGRAYLRIDDLRQLTKLLADLEAHRV
jgi:hypothetical protein